MCRVRTAESSFPTVQKKKPIPQIPPAAAGHSARGPKWTVHDSIVKWLKVKNAAGRAYFILWDQAPAFLAIDLLAVIPGDPSESTTLTVPLAAGELPGLQNPEIATSVIRDPDLVKIWRKERAKLVKAGDLVTLRVRTKRPGRTGGGP